MGQISSQLLWEACRRKPQTFKPKSYNSKVIQANIEEMYVKHFEEINKETSDFSLTFTVF